MTILRYDETDRFRVRDDNGTEHEVVEYTEILSDRRRRHLGAAIPGAKMFRTTEGRHVNRRGEEYEIMTDGLDEPTVLATRITLS